MHKPLPTTSATLRRLHGLATAMAVASLLGMTACGGGGVEAEEPAPNRRGAVAVTIPAGSAAGNVAGSAAGVATPAALAAPQASQVSGVHATTQFVALQAAPGAAIHYTLDGSLPTAQSPVYHQMLVLETSGVVRAAAFAPGQERSAAITVTAAIEPARVQASDAVADLFLTVPPTEADTAVARSDAHAELRAGGQLRGTADLSVDAEALGTLPTLPTGWVAAGQTVALYVNGRFAGLHTVPAAAGAARR